MTPIVHFGKEHPITKCKVLKNRDIIQSAIQTNSLSDSGSILDAFGT